MLQIDGTYKLLKNNYSVVVAIVSDRNHVGFKIAYGITLKENHDSYEFFF